MKLDDLDLRELLELDPQGGVMRFAGERAILLDTMAMGVLRRTLIDTVGVAGARGVLTRFGYAHGRRMASTLKTALPWDSPNEWRIAGGRIHKLQGLVVSTPVRAPTGGAAPFVEALWSDSYEAEQHLIHLGRSEEPVCWHQCGFTSGYLSYANEREIYCVEVRCRGRGDAVCHMVVRTREDWGDELAAHLPYYETSGLDAALEAAARKLKQTERKLRSRAQQLAPYRARVEASGLTVNSPAMDKVVELATRVARVDSTVLLLGESGVGKERMARLVHQESARAAQPLVAINCGALPEQLLESELFGHVRGAFTGATQDRTGLFEQASGGTLFLDEIGEVSPAMQVKLLRALQEHEVRRLGENQPRVVDVRVIAATNRALADEVKAGRFRQDLYYRLRVIELAIPPLRERREDILPLARVFLARVAERTRSRITSFTAAAADRLQRYPWPGNVRELENAIERAVVLATGSRIDVDDLPAELAGPGAGAFAPGDARSLADVEKAYILAVLAAHGGNRAKAAAHLQIGQATLYRRLAAYGVLSDR